MPFKRRFFQPGVPAKWNHTEHREQRHLTANLYRRFKCNGYKTNKKYYETSFLYECVEKISMIVGAISEKF